MPRARNHTQKCITSGSPKVIRITSDLCNREIAIISCLKICVNTTGNIPQGGPTSARESHTEAVLRGLTTAEYEPICWSNVDIAQIRTMSKPTENAALSGATNNDFAQRTGTVVSMGVLS